MASRQEWFLIRRTEHIHELGFKRYLTIRSTIFVYIHYGRGGVALDFYCSPKAFKFEKGGSSKWRKLKK
ncbi:hypothetical protein CFK40_14040 [Virgibacillus necropolis]|uniref:Uncharacterized protein n=1 Tax=Virgibacillus necropolis TaxID=163877 RepID=A0A221MEI0_9BACI|nr:hypothetical protein CFK40_14040 [Virgibacillus necropolis]